MHLRLRSPRLPDHLITALFALLCAVSVSTQAQKSVQGKGWTVIDTSGAIHSRMLDYTTIYSYHSGAAIAKDDRAWMLIDRYGNRLTKADYEVIIYAGEDLWIIGSQKKFGSSPYCPPYSCYAEIYKSQYLSAYLHSDHYF